MRLMLFTLPNCPKCPAAKAVAEAVTKMRDDTTLEVIDISNIENMTAALMMQIASTPSFVIDETPIFVEEVPSMEVLNARIDEYRHKKLQASLP